MAGFSIPVRGAASRERSRGLSAPWAVITGLRARAAALSIGLSLAVVSATTGFVSYTHISALTLALGQSWKTAHLTPLFIDGQIVIGSVFYMVLPGRKRWFGMLGVVPGIGESLFANWESSSVHGTTLHSYEAHAWATVAAQAFAVSSFLFERWLKEQAGHAPALRAVTRMMTAAPATALRLAELVRSVPQAGPAAPGAEPGAVATLVHVLKSRPATLGWGYAPAVPEPQAPAPEQSEQGPAPAGTSSSPAVLWDRAPSPGLGWPGSAGQPQVRGPVRPLADKPKAVAAVAQAAGPAERDRLADTLSITKLSAALGITYHAARKMKEARKAQLAAREEVTSHAA